MIAEVERKSYSSAKDIPASLLTCLSKGQVESKTLAEITAIDIALLMKHNIPSCKKRDMSFFSGKMGILKKMKEAAVIVSDSHGFEYHKNLLANKKSDTLRGIGAFMVGENVSLTAKQKVKAIVPYAKDAHFGVREWAWMAIRNDIANDFGMLYECIFPLSTNRNEYVKRFSVESIRPRGVWAAHITELKTNPGLAEPLIDNLFLDKSRYVNDSVGNWLNDAAKDNPDWVKKKCQKVLKNSDAGAAKTVDYVVSKATRSFK